MGQPDTVTKTFISDNEVFAEIFNYFIYKGKQIIKPEDLTELDTTEIIDPFGKDGITALAVQKFRDVLKSAEIKTDGKVTYCLLAVENQTSIHYAMPVKNGLYDFIQYSNQVSAIAKNRRNTKTTGSQAEFLSGLNKEDVITPVITLTISFSGNKWDGPLTLHEMFGDYPKEILALVPDYKINLIEPFTMSKKDLAKFETDFGAVMEFIKHSSNRNQLLNVVNENDKFKHLSFEAARVIDACANNKLTKLGIKNEVKGDVNVCKAIDDLIADAKQEGYKECQNAIDDLIYDAKQEGRSEALTEMQSQIAEAKQKVRLEMQSQIADTEAEAKENELSNYVNSVLGAMRSFNVDAEHAIKSIAVPDEIKEAVLSRINKQHPVEDDNLSDMSLF